MTGDTHYDLETLAELAEGLLDVATAARVREHLAVCDPCGERLADLAAVREVLAAVPVPVMPMGVALRVDRAIAVEAERRAAGMPALDPGPVQPDWDRLLRDAPWERDAREAAAAAPEAPAEEVPVPEPAVREPARPRLGVVSDDGTVVPARRRESAAKPRKAGRRRLWAIPVGIAAASAVVGALTFGGGLLAGGDGAVPVPSIALGSADPGTADPGHSESGYAIGESDYNYTDKQLRGPVMPLFAARGPIVEGGSSVETKITNCLDRLTAQSGTKPFIVDKGYYNGQEAVITAFWEDQAANSVLVRVVSPDCKDLRKPSLTTWN